LSSSVEIVSSIRCLAIHIFTTPINRNIRRIIHRSAKAVAFSSSDEDNDLSSERAAKMDALLKEMEYDASLETTFTMKHKKHYIMIVIWMGKR
jgi:hypothetical protein